MWITVWAMAEASPLPPTVAQLAAWPRFHGLPAEFVGLIATAGRQREYPSGSVLAHQRDPTDGLHIVIDGAVQIERWHGALVSPVVLAAFGPGEVVANRVEMPEGGRVSASVVAIEPTTTLEIDGETIALLVEQYPRLEGALVCRISDAPAEEGTEAPLAGGAAPPLE